MSAPIVLLVPGVSGSELYTPPSFFGLGPRIKVWLSYSTIAAGGWRWLALAPDGISPTVPLTGPLVPGGPLIDYYGILVNSLNARGWPVSWPQLDWRQTIALDGARLAAAIRAQIGYAPIHLVCHSRGGLVARSALAELAASGDLGLIGRVVGLGVPHYGSWQACGLLAGWNPTGRLISQVIYGIESILLNPALAGTLDPTIRSWPSSYALLPSPIAPGLTPVESAAIWKPAGWSAIGVPLSDAWLAYQLGAWPMLASPPAGVPWLDIVGSGYDTPVSLVGSLPPASLADLMQSVEGDGVVPSAWQTQPGSTPRVVTCQHSAYPYTEAVIDATDAWLRLG